jgi:hypothetical protein
VERVKRGYLPFAGIEFVELHTLPYIKAKHSTGSQMLVRVQDMSDSLICCTSR